MGVHLHFLHTTFKLRQRNQYKAWVKKIIETEGFSLAKINYIFLTDKELLEMNKEYLNHDTYTDIITFDLSEKEKTIDGDIYISIDRVEENAMQVKVEKEIELRRVMAHGILHLVGYDDKEGKDRLIMREKEDKYLQLFP